jgi:transposase
LAAAKETKEWRKSCSRTSTSPALRRMRQRECTAPPRVKKSIARLLKALMRALESLDGDFHNAIKASPAWRKNQHLLASVPGVGRIIARTRIADLPELDRLDRRQIAALAGLAPWTRQSGQWRRKSFIGGGRVDVRCALYAERFTGAALVAALYNPDLKAFREKLVAAGKPKMIALLAVARTLLTILNAILRDQTPGRAQNTRPTRQSLTPQSQARRRLSATGRSAQRARQWR